MQNVERLDRQCIVSVEIMHVEMGRIQPVSNILVLKKNFTIDICHFRRNTIDTKDTSKVTHTYIIEA